MWHCACPGDARQPEMMSIDTPQAQASSFRDVFSQRIRGAFFVLQLGGIFGSLCRTGSKTSAMRLPRMTWTSRRRRAV